MQRKCTTPPGEWDFLICFFFVLQVQSSLVSVCIYFFCFKTFLIKALSNSFSRSSTTVRCSSPTMAPIWIWSLLWPSNGTSWRAFSRTTQGEAHSRVTHTCTHGRYFWVSYEEEKSGRVTSNGILGNPSSRKVWSSLESGTDVPSVSQRPFVSLICSDTLITVQTNLAGCKSVPNN